MNGRCTKSTRCRLDTTDGLAYSHEYCGRALCGSCPCEFRIMDVPTIDECDCRCHEGSRLALGVVT